MNFTPDFLILAVGAYLLGSLSTAIIICRLMGLPDPRATGSKNPGATNVLRYGGKKAAAITLAGDALKGLIPVLIAHGLNQDATQMAIVGSAAFLGHLYPVFFGFKGGKGVATAFGVLFAMAWPVGLALLVTWLIMAFLFKISSLSALTAAILSPLYFWWLTPHHEWVIMAAAMSLLLIWRHRSNIKNLIRGKEDRISDKEEKNE